MAMPAARNFSNIHRSSGPGRFGSVGAYQTHGFALACLTTCGGSGEGGAPEPRKPLPGGGDFFLGLSRRTRIMNERGTHRHKKKKALFSPPRLLRSLWGRIFYDSPPIPAQRGRP